MTESVAATRPIDTSSQFPHQPSQGKK